MQLASGMLVADFVGRDVAVIEATVRLAAMFIAVAEP